MVEFAWRKYVVPNTTKKQRQGTKKRKVIESFPLDWGAKAPKSCLPNSTQAPIAYCK